MYDDGDKCENCGDEESTVFIAANEKLYCATCMKKLYPPYMNLLVFNTKGANVFNLETGKFEKYIHSPDDLQYCDWIVRMIQELESGAKLYHLEYHGPAVCCRNSDYGWGQTGSMCMAAACQDAIQKKQHEDRVYPGPKSFYLKWKYGDEIC